MNSRTQKIQTQKIQTQKSNANQKIHNNQILKWQPLPTHQTPSPDTQTHHLDPYPPRDPMDLLSTTTMPIKISYMGLCFTI